MHLDVVCIVLSTVKYHDGLHPTILDLAVVVTYNRVELTWSPSFLTGHDVTVSSAFINILFQFVVHALLGRG